MIRALFSNPPWWCGRRGRHEYAGVRAGSRWPFALPVASRPDRFVPGGYLPYPFFLGYAARYAAREAGADVTFRDSIALRESYASWFEHLETHRYDFLFLESASSSWSHDRALVRRVHDLFPETRIVVTGVITSSRGAEILAEEPVHACIQGEYEKGSARVLGGEAGLIGHDLLSLDEMNAAPFPYLDPLHAHRYWDPHPLGQRAPQAQVWSSRGCPHKCIFCAWPATMTGNDPDGRSRRQVRHYTPEYMRAFLTDWVGRYGFESIYFDDDTFNLGDRHVLGLCEVMAELGLPWSAMCRADSVSLDTWRVMRDAGCFGVKLGFESGNQWVVDHIVKKRLDLERGRHVVRHLKELGLSVHGTFTYGLPGETPEHMLDTKRFIASLPFDSVQESGAAEIDGTPLATLADRGELEAYDGARLDRSYARERDGYRKWQSLAPRLAGGRS